jgi:hypothetical protein
LFYEDIIVFIFIVADIGRFFSHLGCGTQTSDKQHVQKITNGRQQTFMNQERMHSAF